MASTYDYISGLAEYTASAVVKSDKEWKYYLNTAARLYKYPFKEQLLIYAQRPDASACASMETWNDKMHCWVRRGAKGIALIDEEREHGRKLKYVFDVADVYKLSGKGLDPNLWVLKDEHKEAVLKHLEGIYGETDADLGFERRLIEIADRIAEESYRELLPDLLYLTEGSYLEELDEQNIGVRFCDTLSSGIAYMLLSRCGADMDVWGDEFNFEFIHEFNTKDTLTILGNSTTDLSRDVLVKIRRAIREYEKEKAQQQGQNKEEDEKSEQEKQVERKQEQERQEAENLEQGKQDEKKWEEKQKGQEYAQDKDKENKRNNVYAKSEKGIENSDGLNYNDLKRESEAVGKSNAGNNYVESNHEEKGGEGNEYNLREERRLPDTEPESGRTAAGDSDEIRAASGNIPEGTPQRDLYGVPSGRQAEKPSAGDTGTGGSADGEHGREDGESAGSGLEAEGGKPDAMGAENEQHQGIGGGSGAGRTGIQPVNNEKGDIQSVSSEKDDIQPVENPEIVYEQLSLFPSIDEQLGTIASKEAGMRYKLPASFSFGQEKIEEILRTGGGKENSRKRIYAKYAAGKSAEEMVEFLKTEYGVTCKGFHFGSNPVSVWFDEKGMRVGYGTSVWENCVAVYGWEEIEKNIRAMVENGDYVSANEAFFAVMEEYERVATDIYFFFRDGLDEFPEAMPEEAFNFPNWQDKTQKLLSDKEGLHRIREELKTVKADLDSGKRKLKWNHVRRPEALIGELDDLGADKIKYPLKNVVEILEEDFITQDEIDYALLRGSNVEHSKFRIYEFFMEMHSHEENISFLKKEYGISGISNALPGNERSYQMNDSKGILLDKCFFDDSGARVKVLLNWKCVEKRLCELIGQDRYLFPREKEKYNEYRRIQSEKEIGKEIEKDAKKVENAEKTAKLTGVPEPEELAKAAELEERAEEAEPEKNTEIVKSEEMEGQAGATELEDDGWISMEGKRTPFDEEPEEWRPSRLITASIPDKGRAINFRITEHEPQKCSPKEKFRKNVDAIRLLRKIEEEKRYATMDEQQILSEYTGWGGLSEAFDETKANWIEEYKELKGLLSPAEYASARESTLSAYYTPPVVIKGIYQTLAKMGFEKGNLLEPSMGTGKFFGMLPEEMGESRLYGVELDGITGRIAKLLYPNADIKVQGFEKTDYPDDFFDVAVGNVPFGAYQTADKRYDRHHFRIHDYFLAKSIDKVRQGGVIAMITSNALGGGTMDVRDGSARNYFAQRCDLLGAVRLPQVAFADTDITTDILFFQKRETLRDLSIDMPEWVQTDIVHESDDETKDGRIVHNTLHMNKYFISHPEMVLGKPEVVSGPFGPQLVCKAEGENLAVKLENALSHIEGHIEMPEPEEIDDIGSAEKNVIPADPNARNFSYTVINGDIYYRENSLMKRVELSGAAKGRVIGMSGIRDCTENLIDMQLGEYAEEDIRAGQKELNRLYDRFVSKYGYLNSTANKRAFQQDSAYCLLCSLENTDDEGRVTGKADMFYKRTIKKAEVVTSVDTASEALAVSISEKACIDFAYMQELSGKGKEELIRELRGVIFKNPATEEWETADAYLSGRVREKLEMAKEYAKETPEYLINAEALMGVQPKELEAGDIGVRIGATWIDAHYIEDFMRETFETPEKLFDRKIIGVSYSEVTAEWRVMGKSSDIGNTLVNVTYGTNRINAYKILEDSLNLKDCRIYDIIEEDGREKRVLNKKETMIAGQKQEAIREKFKEWIFKDAERRQYLVAKYNRLFNSTRAREYDGSHLTFPGMSPEIELQAHQKSAVAHILYGNNTLLAHCVGAGKTYEMAAAAMESKRLGLCRKSLFVVPNHLTEQWAGEFLRLYPGAKILAARKKDFEPANRKKFCSRISTGNYDAVIIGHTQFEKIPLSLERQEGIIENQIQEIEKEILILKAQKGERYSIRQMEKVRKSLQTRLERLNDRSRKDNVVYFEQLGVDRLFVDESHYYKNLFLHTKMRNVAGIAQSEAQKSSDMFAKCQYLDELTGGKGITFATGTPISNSMTELYTNMRYLQYDTLKRLGMEHFDSWASSFGETVSAVELAPEGTGYRVKTRFAKFYNLPELIGIFKEAADIKTKDMLNLPVPEAEYTNVKMKPSQFQQDIVASLAERAEAVRGGRVSPEIDNMLRITNDGRKLALDQRLINPLLPDEEISKSAECADRAFKIWEETKEKRSAQLIFCDLSTPKGKAKATIDGKSEEAEVVDTFENIYDDIKKKLMAKGVPEEEIAFIHSADTDVKKAKLFAHVRSGKVRFLFGSTQKMGAGTNVQDRLIALHHLDVPWRPSDIEQREGRILRQFNTNEKVHIFRYITEGTFDSYSWQVLENKQKFISQIMTSKSPVRSCEDVDESALTYAEIKALATGNPYIKEKMELDIQVSKLKLMKANHTSQKFRLEDDIAIKYPQRIAHLNTEIKQLVSDIEMYRSKRPANKDDFSMTIRDKTYTDKKAAGLAIMNIGENVRAFQAGTKIGEYLGFRLAVSYQIFSNKLTMDIMGKNSYWIELGKDPLGNITRINNALDGLPKKLEETRGILGNIKRQLENAKIEVDKPFEKEEELSGKLARLTELNALLNLDEKDNDALLMENEPEDDSGDVAASEELGEETEENSEISETEVKVEIVKENGIVQEREKPTERLSLKEKLEIMKEKAAELSADKKEPKTHMERG